jgi:hypothetical protein
MYARKENEEKRGKNEKKIDGPKKTKKPIGAKALHIISHI